MPDIRIPYGLLYNLPQVQPRIIKIDWETYGIESYDLDNGYPQRVESIIKASPTASDCVKMFGKYLIGNGFKDVDFYKAKINARGLTPDKLLRRIAPDFGKFNGFGIHVNWNALYEVDSVSYVPFKSTRVGIEPDYLGRIAIHPDWYNPVKWRGRRVDPKTISYLWKFNSDPAEIERQVVFAGGWEKYQGQIWWHSTEVDDYPLSPYDEVIDPMLTEVDSCTTTRNNVKNNFQAKKIWIDKGEIEDKDERKARNEIIKSFIGPDGNPVAVFESKSTDAQGKANDVPELIDVQNNMNDAIFKYSDDKVRGQIYRAVQQNAILHSDLTLGRYNQNQLPESQEYYNSLITPDKLVIEECFREIFSLFKTPINPTNDYTLIPLPVTKITSPVVSNGNNSINSDQSGLY